MRVIAALTAGSEPYARDPDFDIDSQNRSILEEFRDRSPGEVRAFEAKAFESLVAAEAAVLLIVTPAPPSMKSLPMPPLNTSKDEPLKSRPSPPPNRKSSPEPANTPSILAIESTPATDVATPDWRSTLRKLPGERWV